MTKQPSAEQLLTESDIKAQNELIRYDDHNDLQKNIKNFWGDDGSYRKEPLTGLANSSSLPNLNSKKSSPAPKQNLISQY